MGILGNIDDDYNYKRLNRQQRYEQAIKAAESKDKPKKDKQKTESSFLHELENLILFPFRLMWNIFVIVGTIALEITWVTFICGSIIIAVIFLLFCPSAFIIPLGLFGLTCELWPE